MVKSRKFPRLILSLVLVGTLLLGGCGPSDTALSPPIEPVPAESAAVETAPQPVSQAQESLETEETVKT